MGRSAYLVYFGSDRLKGRMLDSRPFFPRLIHRNGAVRSDNDTDID